MAGIALGLAFGLGSMSCGQWQSESALAQLDPASTQCVEGQSMIAVRDGLLQALCGCEGVDSSVTADELICRVPLGTQLHFILIATQTDHQLMSVGSPTFISSPVYSYRAEFPIRTHVVQFSQTGDYRFEDAFDPRVRGRIEVRE